MLETIKNNNQSKGKAGEDLAKGFLLKQGYQILAERYRTRFGEIDLIAVKKKSLCFVEVKWRSQKEYGDPLQAITPAKIRHLKKAAYGFLWENPIYQKDYSYHLAAIAVRDYLQTHKIQMVTLPPEPGLEKFGCRF